MSLNYNFFCRIFYILSTPNAITQHDVSVRSVTPSEELLTEKNKNNFKQNKAN